VAMHPLAGPDADDRITSCRAVLRFTETARVGDGLAEARQQARSLCAGFAACSSVLVVVAPDMTVLACSRPLNALSSLVPAGQLDATAHPELADAVRSALVAGVQQTVELQRSSAALRGSDSASGGPVGD